MPYDTLPESEEMIAKVVGFLAERGVRYTDVSALALGYPAGNEVDQLFSDSINWLKSENIVRQKSLHEVQGGSSHELVAKSCVLTSHGFALLAAPFDGELTLGAAVKQTASNGAGFANAGSFFGGILGGFTKSISS